MVDDDALSATSAAYDAVAGTYAEMFRHTVRDNPFDRAVLGAFADLVGTAGAVVDLGCGPGHVTAHLAGLGLATFGVDVSPAMVTLARQAYPGLTFEVGSMTSLSIADATLGGVLARWSIIHTPPSDVPGILAEIRRVLAPGGHVLLGFPASDDSARPTQVYDHTVAPAYRWWPDHLAALLHAAGLAETARMICRPEPTDRRQFPSVHLLARAAN
ncbi:class I SAM-dependent methyltransferase [Actinoplanes sp. N902-109]|uniref:class I SAM-dependent methyltransferase n=1 Tax=Actinoplanes sp. (strain N902-109) TaxID=649831 RepID=UPI0003295BA7|nr:class I SAM-dependent methyltransferase [Actinoplanes sp. N902-109]AGL14239.1 methyltransferase [Actinoplanes sp. N902-109]